MLKYNYLKRKYLKVSINESILWSLIKYGVPYGSILGPTLFNRFSCDMFYILDIASYAAVSTLYTVEPDKCHMRNRLEPELEKIFNWFKNNVMKASQRKCSAVLSIIDINSDIKLSCEITHFE